MLFDPFPWSHVVTWLTFISNKIDWGLPRKCCAYTRCGCQKNETTDIDKERKLVLFMCCREYKRLRWGTMRSAGVFMISLTTEWNDAYLISENFSVNVSRSKSCERAFMLFQKSASGVFEGKEETNLLKAFLESFLCFWFCMVWCIETTNLIRFDFKMMHGFEGVVVYTGL